MTNAQPKGRVFVALDTTDAVFAETLARKLAGTVSGLKLGKEFFTANGPQGVARITGVGLPVFLDLKYHDIANTVAGAVRAALPMKPAMLNVHAGGGKAMMEAAAKAAAEAGDDRPSVIAVTVLTSLDDADLGAMGVTGSASDHVLRLANLTQEAGLDGVVCSAREIEILRKECGPNFRLVVPGIRPTWAATGDQKRIMTPSDALNLGADDLVIGRPITGADDPAAAAKLIADEIGNR